MIILTDCLSEKIDEGCLKIANSLIKRIKLKDPETVVVSYKRYTEQSDRHMRLNRLFLNPELFQFLRKKKEPLLYIPFASNTKATILRTWVLSRLVGCKVSVLFSLRYPMNGFFTRLLEWSGAQIVTLSQTTHQFFGDKLKNPTHRLKAGVDLQTFAPADPVQKMQLRKQYGIPSDETVALHVGHLKEGRNLRKLLQIPKDFWLILVISTLQSQDLQLRQQLEARPKTIIIDTYLKNIAQIYQLSDVYIFPVQETGNCIDVPVSALEAAACGIPVIATRYGELQELLNEDGFYPIESFDPIPFGELLHRACRENISGRQYVLDYDWTVAVNDIVNLLQKK